jgi:methionyl-tRNA formyltransferase
MKIIFLGTPQFAVPILEMLYLNHQVLLVVTQPDKPVGRKKVMMSSPVKEKARSLSLPVFQPDKLKNDYQLLLDLKPDYLITAAYGQMLPKELLDSVMALNVHGSLLPKYRGGAPIQYALFDGLKETGVTIMYMAFQMDSGDIIKQESIPIFDEDNYQTLSTKLSVLGTKLLKEVLSDLEKGVIKRTPQELSLVTFAKTLSYQDEQLDFNLPTQQIINRIKGLSPEPGASAKINDVTLKFFNAIKSDIIDLRCAPGTVLIAKNHLVIKTLDGAIEIKEIQAPGKKKMNVKDFLNGQNILKVDDMFEEGKK